MSTKESDIANGENLSTKPDMTFTREIRRRTRKQHNWSNILVNTKFALALYDDAVWFDGLLAFYEIYKFFEKHLPERLLPKELYRTAAFEKDFDFYYGPNWRDNYKPRPSVQKYIDHLEGISKKGELSLFAYAYQMYMALMTGAQLLQKKRMISLKLCVGTPEEIASIKAPLKLIDEKDDDFDEMETRPIPEQVKICPPGCAATYFADNLSDLKDKLRTILNDNYGKLDENQREDFIQETCTLFLYNGEVVQSIKGVNRAGLRIAAWVGLFALGVFLANKIF